jgi:hypothetical protein
MLHAWDRPHNIIEEKSENHRAQFQKTWTAAALGCDSFARKILQSAYKVRSTRKQRFC